MKKCKMISFDSSTVDTGYAVWLNAVLADYNNIAVSEDIPLNERFPIITNKIIELLNKENPDIVVIELTVVPKNAHTQRILTMILGVVYGWCITNNCEYVTFRPSEWRKIVYANSPIECKNLKEKAILEVKRRYGIDLDNHNIAEAILIGLARILQFQ